MCFLPGCFCNSLVFGIWFFPLEQTGHGLNKVGHCCHPLNVKNSVSVFIKTKWPLLPFLFSFFDIFLYSKLSQPHIYLAIYFSSLQLLTNLTLHKNFFFVSESFTWFLFILSSITIFLEERHQHTSCCFFYSFKYTNMFALISLSISISYSNIWDSSTSDSVTGHWCQLGLIVVGVLMNLQISHCELILACELQAIYIACVGAAGITGMNKVPDP